MYVKLQEGKCLRNFEQVLYENGKFVVDEEGAEVDEEIMKMADSL